MVRDSRIFTNHESPKLSVTHFLVCDLLKSWTNPVLNHHICPIPGPVLKNFQLCLGVGSDESRGDNAKSRLIDKLNTNRALVLRAAGLLKVLRRELHHGGASSCYLLPYANPVQARYSSHKHFTPTGTR